MSLAECGAGVKENIFEKINTEAAKCHFIKKDLSQKEFKHSNVSPRFFSTRGNIFSHLLHNFRCKYLYFFLWLARLRASHYLIR